MKRHLSAARILAALIAAGAIAGTALAVDPSGSPSASPGASSSAAAPSLAASATPSNGPSPSATASPLLAATPPPASSAPAKPEVKEPETKDDDEGVPSAEKIADVVGRLKAAGVPATSGQVQDLSGKVGMGGAVRVLAFAHASGKTPAQILAMFTGGMGWGQIDHELHLSIGPGIGWIMGNEHAKNQKP